MRKLRRMRKRFLASTLAMTMALSCAAIPVGASQSTKDAASTAVNTVTDSRITPHAASYGYYVDVYKNNETSNMTPESNPSIGVLSKFLELYTPGASWDTGTVVNQAVHNANLINTAIIAGSRTKEMEEKAYLDDRRHQSYSVISGLGGYAEVFKAGTNAGTTIRDEIPGDATTVKYDDKGNENGNWAEVDSTYGAMVQLVNTVRYLGASTSSAKAYYKYMRPFRWTQLVQVEDLLQPCIKSDPSNDGGFPSGHTNAAYLTAYAFAYAVPERFQELITRASELGNNRIVAGMHSCLDVMGGRVMSTAVAAAALNDPDNQEIKEAAYEAARKLLKETPVGTDDYADYETNKMKNLERLTYGMKQIGDTTKEMVVPKGAEVLIETRLPYLDATQLRYVLYTTGLESGYPLLDDEEGWGRLNLFEAANGYGAFVTDVTVTMDAEKGGFHAADNWRNDIDGTGSLTKEGSGSLTLSGNNTYSGGTTVNGGAINATSTTAFGVGDVANKSTISEDVNGIVAIKGNYKQSDGATLALTVSRGQDVFQIDGEASFDGTLSVTFTEGFVPSEKVKIVSYQSGALKQKFDAVEIKGLSEVSEKEIVYEADGIYMVAKSATPAPTVAPVTQQKQTITTKKSTYTKTYGDKAFSITANTNASGVKLTYKSSNSKVASVGSKSGKVTIKGCGQATITITAPSTDTFKSTKKTVTITVEPKKARVSNVTRDSKTKILVNWKKDSKATGYQIRYSTSKKFTKASTKTTSVTKNSILKKTITVKKGKTYYVSVRAYKQVGKQKIYGSWSTTKAVK